MVQSVSFEDSPLWPEVESIILQKSEPTKYEYRVTLHSPTEEMGVWDMNSIEYFRDYLHDIGESVRIRFKMGAGDYVGRLYPHRNNLEVTLRKIPVFQGNQERKEDPTVIRYKAIFVPNKNMSTGISELENHQADDLNISDMVEVYLELIDRCLEPLRIKTTGGAFQNVTVGDVIEGLMVQESSKIRVDGQPALHGFDLVQPDNQEPQANIVIPHGTRMSALPSFLQQRQGVYSRGIGTYYQTYEGKKYWFVYPVYGSERFEAPGRKAIFYSVPQEKFPQIDKSYILEGDILKIAVTAQRRYSDSAELRMMNEGSGFRMPDARSFMRKPIEITKDGLKAIRHRLNHEVVLKDRDDGLNYAPATREASANPFIMRSQVLSQYIAQIDLVWENAAVDYLYPGMPCKFVHVVQGEAVSLLGSILFVHAFASRTEKQGATAFAMTARITIACDPYANIPELPESEVIGENPYLE
jgi:hypothetical protein